LFGPYPEGVPLGHGHYGWAIWGCVFLSGTAAGAVIEILQRRKKKQINKI